MFIILCIIQKDYTLLHQNLYKLLVGLERYFNLSLEKVSVMS